MNDELRAVWERYVAAWKVPSPAEKRLIFGTCLAPGCIYTDPLTQARGWDELDEYMTSFHQQIPGGHFVTEQFFAHHGRSVARCVVRQAEADSDRLEYHAAIAVTAVAALPEGMVSVQIPTGTYARFTHRGPAPRIDHTVNYAYATWLAQSDYRHTYAPDLESYGAAYHPTNDDSVFHYAIPIGRN